MLCKPLSVTGYSFIHNLRVYSEAMVDSCCNSQSEASPPIIANQRLVLL